MMKKRNINLLLFSLFLAILIVVPILRLDVGRLGQNGWSKGPWHLEPFGADSLSQHYKDNYRVFDDKPLEPLLQDSAKALVVVLVDGWGIPYDEGLLESDFQIMKNNETSYVVHKRASQHTSHAESVEYGRGFNAGLLLINGDPMDCEKIEEREGSLFKQTLCCEMCDDSHTVVVLDSLVSEGSWNRIAWTARSPREGNRDKLHDLLKQLSELAGKYPDVQFIIQGTHRPILGSPETRRKYLAPWVPAVFINCEPQTK